MNKKPLKRSGGKNGHVQFMNGDWAALSAEEDCVIELKAPEQLLNGSQDCLVKVSNEL